MKLKLLSWNVAGRKSKLPGQASAIGSHEPDLLALQEVTITTLPRWRDRLAEVGFEHLVDSSDRLAGRKYCNLIASRWPVEAEPPLDIPFAERLLSVKVDAEGGVLELHNAHLPTGVGSGIKKIEVFEAIYKRLARGAEHSRILCGDFNAPLSEGRTGRVMTAADRHRKYHDRWDAGERSVLLGLGDYDLADVFRSLHGYGMQAGSWVARRQNGQEVLRRFDHVFASARLNPTACDYIDEWRTSGLSDHSAIEAVFDT